MVTAGDGRAGVASSVEAQPDIVLLDSDLPDADALDVCREIRRRLQPLRLPVFLLIPEHERHSGRPLASDDAAQQERQWNYFEYGFGLCWPGSRRPAGQTIESLLRDWKWTGGGSPARPTAVTSA